MIAKQGNIIGHDGAGLGEYAIAEKDAGDYTYDISLTNSDLPENGNYSVSLYVRQGRLRILPKELTVTTGSDEKTYDGTPLTNDEASISELVAADEGKIEITATGSQTEVGSSKNTYSIDWGDVKPTNYKIVEELGTLEVKEAQLKITVKDATKVYNGSEQKGYDAPATVTGTGAQIETDEYIIEGLANGQVLTISGYTPSKGTGVDTYEDGTFQGATITVKSDDDDVTENYTIKKTAGKLTITPLEVTVAVEDKTEIYNGAEQKGNTVYTFSNIVDGQTATITYTPSKGTTVGAYDNG